MFLQQIVMMKTGYYTIMWNRRDHGASEMNYHVAEGSVWALAWPVCIGRMSPTKAALRAPF